MRVAIAHDYLNQYGGAERVLEVLLEIFPDAPIYTLLYDEEKTLSRFKNRRVIVSFLNRFQTVKNYHRPFIPLMPLAQKFLNLKNEYDLIISSAAGFAKGINYQSGFHISYCHAPLRYAWEENYLDGYSLFKNPIIRVLAKPALISLREWDRSAAKKVDIFLANSNFIAAKIKRYYNRDSYILYPPVDIKKFYLNSTPSTPNFKPYYLMVGRLMHYKRFDLGIDAFIKLGLPLKIIGAGPEKKSLELRIKNSKVKNIELIDFVSDEKLREFYNNARALIFPQTEDFGLVAAEAQACGAPVIAFNAGGAKEIIIDGKTGLFFNEQTPSAIISAVQEFSLRSFSRPLISKNAERFSKENFKRKFKEILAKTVSNHQLLLYH